jgi:hypothetical protein
MSTTYLLTAIFSRYLSFSKESSAAGGKILPEFPECCGPVADPVFDLNVQFGEGSGIIALRHRTTVRT